MAFIVDDVSINTIIGPGASVTGDIRVPGLVRVDGDIDGDLETTGKIIIGEKARIRGNITAKSANVGGFVLGDIRAPDGIRLFSTSVVIGDIVSHRVEIAENVLFHGHCISLKRAEEFDAALAERQTTKTIAARAGLLSPPGESRHA
jgi:cytoskeletal protein CcmA (bactofilin family)